MKGTGYWYAIYRRNAKQKKLKFKITRQEFDEIVSQPCHYCGAPPSQRSPNPGGSRPHINGIDRINCDIGYVSGNLAPCCIRCNYTKGRYITYAQMLVLGRVLSILNFIELLRALRK